MIRFTNISISSNFAGLNKQFVFYQDTLATSKGNNSNNLCLPRAWRVCKWHNIKFHCGNFSEDDVQSSQSTNITFFFISLRDCTRCGKFQIDFDGFNFARLYTNTSFLFLSKLRYQSKLMLSKTATSNIGCLQEAPRQ